jgi:hypothetical protein
MLTRISMVTRCLVLGLLASGGLWFSAESSEGKSQARVAPKVLFLGDSQSLGAFGTSFEQHLREAGCDVHTVVAGGASPYYWLKAHGPMRCSIGYWEKSSAGEQRVTSISAVPKLEDLLLTDRPNVVVVQMGVNLYASLRSKRWTDEENEAKVRGLLTEMGQAVSTAGAVSYWILPPKSHPERYSLELQQRMARLMKETVESFGGVAFESQAVTEYVDSYPVNDGIHYGPEQAREWSGNVFASFQGFLQNGPVTQTPTVLADAVKNAVENTPELGTDQKPTPVLNASAETVLASLVPNGAEATALRSLPVADDFAPSPSDGPPEMPADMPAEVHLVMKLAEKSVIDTSVEIDYDSALGVFEYEVVRDNLGNYPHDRIRVAQGIVFRKRFTSAVNQTIGTEVSLVLVPLSTYRTLSTWQITDDLPVRRDLPLYTPKLD